MNLMFVVRLLPTHLTYRRIDHARCEVVRTGKVSEADLVEERRGGGDEVSLFEVEVVPADLNLRQAHGLACHVHADLSLNEILDCYVVAARFRAGRDLPNRLRLSRARRE